MISSQLNLLLNELEVSKEVAFVENISIQVSVVIAVVVVFNEL